MRSTHDMIRFENPFTLRELDGVQPAGTYMVVTEEEQVSGLSFLSWRRTATLIHLPAIGGPSGRVHVSDIDPRALAAAVQRDVEMRPA